MTTPSSVEPITVVSTDVDIPLGLINAIESGKCVLFIGAGVGKHLITNGKPLPTGRGLAHELCEKFGMEKNDDLTLVSKVVELEKGRPELESFISKRFSDAQPDDDFQWLMALRWRSIYTTNYDEGIKRSFDLNGNLKQKPVIFSLSQDIVDYDPRLEVPIIHLHGALFGEHRSKIVITDDDYVTFKEKRRMLFELLKKDAAVSTVVYVGYSNKDPNWTTLIKELQDEFYPAALPSCYRVDPYPDDISARVLAAKGISTIKTDLSGFVAALKVKTSVREAAADIETYKKDIPSDFHAVFDENVPATLRLFNSWVYINQAPFQDKINLKPFLQGDKANWALIAASGYFERDIEDKIYEECLDYITSPKRKATVINALAPAGYGITTLLMSLAVKLVKQNAAKIFFLKEGAIFNEGDVEFVAKPNIATIFFVDNASEYKNRISNIIHKFRERGLPILFVLGSRKNEWTQAGNYAIGGKEFGLDQLSKHEINKLLEFLSKYGSLGVLEPLSHDLRVAAIKTKLGNELLVTMREATEGKAFDAILEGEYRNILNDEAQKIYLIVSCFYQFGNLLRTGLLAEILGQNEAKIHPIINKHLEGVVIHDDINPALGIFGLRPRHRKIAEIVWERCGEKGLQEDVLQSSLEKLNLNYKSDRDAFDNFIQADHLIDLIRTLEGKIKFFETACKKEPHNAYIWQHYARMFSREKRFDLALDQIEKALLLEKKRILYHTKGKILADLACSESRRDIARKRLSQSESAFRQGLGIKTNDEYCIHGLGELFFNWAVVTADEDEANEYLARAESEILEGLKVAPSKEMLWILSSKIADYLGDNPKKIEALQKAVTSTQNAHFARYLLGRAYRKQGKFQDGLDVLMPAFKSNPEDFRLSIEAAYCTLGLGKPYAEAIAILNISTLQGLKDARFIAMFGGLQYLDGKYTDSERTFGETIKQQFSYDERRTFSFKPHVLSDPSIALTVAGKVADAKRGFAWIEVPGLPRNIPCPGSKWGNLFLSPGMYVECDLVFNAEGPLAVNPKDKPRLI